ncbi:undecaprenyldiphospho-muramoylpentapeptide beta-N-acetylglucosaminyltransferase [bacterium]|nr:undecaprenyldiphospho-muramoylpentapeptide beta-N-acetylglucosaminyltransferase [bacterium]
MDTSAAALAVTSISPPAGWAGPLLAEAARGQRGVFLFAGGGTGGHLFPGIALAEALQARYPAVRMVFAGSDRPIERRIVESAGVEHHILSTASPALCRRRPDQFVWRNWRAVVEARRLVKRERPQIVIGLGGFASAPVIWAAYRSRVPVVLLEQNAVPGRATCWLSRFARVVCTAFDETIDWLPRHVPTLVCGNPVRKSIAALHAEPLETQQAQRCLLVLGGSQGADGLNMGVVEMLRQHPEFRTWKVIHQTGPRQLESIRTTYHELQQPALVADFFEEMPDIYRQADLIISRAGATTVAELACAGRATVLVPYPQATDNHQRVNADAFARQGAALVVEQALASPQTAERLWTAVAPLLDDGPRRRRMAKAARDFACPDAAQRIVNLLQAEQSMAVPA